MLRLDASPSDSSVAGRAGADRQSVDPVFHQIAERFIDRALPLKPAHPGKVGRFDLDREMALAAAIMPGVAAMPAAVVDHSKPGRSECFAQAFLDFGGDRSG